MESKLSLSDYAAKLPPEARKRYVEKLIVKGEGLPDPYQLNSGWLSDPLHWPDLTFGDIYTYSSDCKSMYTHNNRAYSDSKSIVANTLAK